MSPAHRKNLALLLDQPVRIEWRDPDNDWPTFRLLAVCSDDNTLLLEGIADEQGNPHSGDRFWVDWSDVRAIWPMRHAVKIQPEEKS